MLTPNLIIGIIFVLLSIVVLLFPSAIAGYNTLSSEEKKKIRIKELSRFVFKILFSVGIIIIIGDYFFLWLKLPYLNYILHPILYILMVVILFLKRKKYIHQD